jgi:YVTN family beta-propeller protein
VKLRFRKGRVAIISLSLLSVCATTAVAATYESQTAGPRGDGTAVVPTGYQVTPAGKQTALGDLPLHEVASPDGRWLVTTNDGQGAQSLQVLDTRTGKTVQTVKYASPEALFAGLAFSPDGKTLYASAGGNNKIRTYSFASGRLTEGASIPLPTTSATGKKINPYPAGIAITPDGGRLVVADRLADAVTVIDVHTGAQKTVGVGHAPYWVTLSTDGNKGWVTEQGSNTVSVLDTSAGNLAPLASITVGTHPNKAIADKSGKHLFVANGDSDQVSVVDTETNKVSRTISLAPYEGAQVGSTPDALALSPDERTLYVAHAGNNDIAVVDTANGNVRGLIPTGWYPTSVLSLNGNLLVTNAKGLGAGPNNGPGYPNPESSTPSSPAQYAGSMIVGTLSTISLSNDAQQLAKWTKQVRDNNGFDGRGEVGGAQASTVVPLRAGQSSPIKHVIYVVRENRTYDQVLGSLGKGNGDPSLNLFGNESAPNARALASQFVTLDNFYADAEVSAQGWNWAVAANSNHYSETGWPANYSGRNHSYPSENGDPAIAPNSDPANAYIWDRLANANISFRNYGFYVSGSAGNFVAADPKLNANTNHSFRGFDMGCADSAGTFNQAASCGTPRVDEWMKEFNGYVASNSMPTMEFVRLGTDHTQATKAGAPTPKAYVADNDLALGRLVDAVSHSKYWKDTAIMVTEDDAQNGPDHVDAHRTIAEVISPYTRTGRVDSTFYSTSSMLHTIELLVGIKPMTQFDAFAAPMFGAFTPRPNAQPYSAITPTTPLDQRNTAAAPMADQSATQNTTVEDAIDMQTFNQAIWQSVKGVNAPMPAPVHTLGAPAPAQPAASGPDGDGH